MYPCGLGIVEVLVASLLCLPGKLLYSYQCHEVGVHLGVLIHADLLQFTLSIVTSSQVRRLSEHFDHGSET